MIQGKASIIGGKESEQNELVLLQKAHKMLSGKYVQYQEIGIGHYIIALPNTSINDIVPFIPVTI